MTFFWLAVLAHVFTDFVLQTDRLAAMKAEMKPGAYLKHGLALMLCTFVATHVYGPGPALAFSAAAALVHILIDYLKNLIPVLQRPPGTSAGRTTNTVCLFLDQALHLYALYLLWFIFSRAFTISPCSSVFEFYAVFFPTLRLPDCFAALGYGAGNCVISAVICLYVLFGGVVIVRMQLDHLNIEKSESPAPSTGRYIGILERAVILILIMYDAVTAVGFVLAVKSIARFKQLEDRAFAEYYLVGTLISTLTAVAGGFALRALWR
ncbi:MAG: DUF3307 domain-containing protein [Bacillota bacterium]